jgi:ketosteroid isomerase-like protein
MKKRVRYLSALLMLAIPFMCAAQSSHEKKIWSLETSYWEYVKANDLDKYRTLWNSNFLGWPYGDTEPAGKERITGWIETHTGKSEKLKSFQLEPLQAKATDAFITVGYRVHLVWTDKDGPGALRIVHTWANDGGSGKWQIISGMGAPTNADGK